jgi:hypothetical protein
MTILYIVVYNGFCKIFEDILGKIPNIIYREINACTERVADNDHS